MASGPRWHADMARGTNTWMQRDTEATWQSHGWPARGAGGADMPRGRVHAGAREGRHVACGGGTHMEGPRV